MPNTLDKIRLSAVTYDIVDSTAVHSLDGYPTVDEMNTAITASSAAVLETVQEAGYQTSGDVQNAISGKVDTTTYTAFTASTDTALGNKADTTALTQVNDALTAHTADTDIHVTTAQTAGWDAKADISDIPSVSGYADSVKYNSTSKYVEFYHGGTGGTKVFEYDASPFLIDGMVQNVEIKDVPITEAASTANTAYTFTSGLTTEFVIKVTDSWWTDGNSSVEIIDSIDPNIWTLITHNGQTLDIGRNASGTSSGNTIYVTATGSTAFDTVRIYTDWSEYESIEAVYGSVTCLVISFNTDAGKQDINVPLTAVFDPSNYVDMATYTAYTAATDTVLGNKADTTAMTQAISEATSGKADTTAVTQAISEATSGKANSSDVYLKTETSGSTELNTAFGNKQDTLVSQTNIKSINGSSILGSGDLTVDTGLHAEVTGTTLIFS